MSARQARYSILLLFGILTATFLSNCKEGIVSVSAPILVHISGTVLDANSSTPLSDASVVLLVGSTKDSAFTKSDGTFEFVVDVPDSTKGANITITVNETGYLTKTIGANVKSDESYQISLSVNPSTYAVVTGAVRDSTTGYPLRDASVLISLPGVVDSAASLQDGSFTVNVNLVDLDSLSVTVTVSKAGFKIYRIARTIARGPNSLGTIRLPIDKGSTFAHVVGHVTDSRSGQPVTNVSVLLSSSLTVDSTKTLSDGSYSFDLNLQGPSSVSGTLTFRLSGFRDTTVSFAVNAGQTLTQDMTLATTLNYAIVSGTVRDSASGLPLQGASVLISLPGSVSKAKLASLGKAHLHSISSLVLDSTTTLVDGSFSMAVNLVDLDSISTTMTVTKPGFKIYQTGRTFYNGMNNLGSILIQVNNNTSIAHITGHVTDSRTSLAIPNVSVLLTSSIRTDSTTTLNDGSYSFDVDLKGLSSTTGLLLFHLSGYNDMTVNFTANAGQTLNEDVVLTFQQSATYANVSGTVRDSTTGYPLGGATVLISLPGSSSSAMKLMSHNKLNAKSVSSLIIDSTTTLADGSFAMNVNLFDLDSMSATMTITKPGFIIYQTVQTFKKGTNNLGNILIKIDNGSSVAHVFGYVRDGKSGLPITGVSVLLSSAIKVDSLKTLTDGSYSFDEDLKGLTSLSGTLLFRLNSYNDTTVSFTVSAGKALEEDVALSAKPTVVGGDSSTGRGVARSIALVSVSRQEIAIHGVGENETSLVAWQVLDSLGFPIDINHRVNVTFILLGIPVTGDPQSSAYVTPTFGATDGSGQISTTVNSGTVAGTIQLVAKLKLSNGTVVQSSPVLITIDGGLPDQAHFELNSNPPHAANFAGYDWSEVTQGFTVQAGDKYGNPVTPNTAIYFTTTAGVITAAGQTGATGHANATLYSGFPLPKLSGLDPTRFGDGTGYAYVKAFTQGENNTIVADSSLICISASAASILFNDSTSIQPIQLHDSIGYAVVRVHVSDRFGNPLESGTTIGSSVDITPPPPNSNITWSIKSGGLPSDGSGTGLGDYLTRGPGSTDFTLVITGSAYPASVLDSSPLSFSVTVKVSGRNTGAGMVSNTFTGQLVP